MKRKIFHKIQVLILLFLLQATASHGQLMALRNNLFYDATLTPNLGMEMRLSPLWSIGVNAGLNAWDIDQTTNKKWRHVLVAPNLRYYVNDTIFHKGYIEADFIYSHFNVGNTRIPFNLYSAVKDRRLQGDLIALGSKYGYSWMLSHIWRLEAEAGLAVGYAWFDEYDCPTCGNYLGKDNRFFLLPLLGFNVVYIIR